MNRLLIVLVVLCSIMCTSCTQPVKVDFDDAQFEYRYIYQSQNILDANFSIARKVVVTNKTTKEKVTFKMPDDIENMDEARFFHVTSLSLDEIRYDNILLIQDPFALVIVDLNELTVLYNSHGQDDIEYRIQIESEEKCIGKVTNRQFISRNCLLEF